MNQQLKDLVINLQREYQFVCKEKQDIQRYFEEIEKAYNELFQKNYIFNTQQFIYADRNNEENLKLEHIKLFFMLESKTKFCRFRDYYYPFEYSISELFKYLSSNTDLIVNILIYMDKFSDLNTKRITNIIYTSIINSGYMENESEKLIQVLISLCERQFTKCKDPQKLIINGKSVFIQLFKYFIDNSQSAKTFLIEILQDPIYFVIQNDDTYLDTNSKLSLERLSYSEKRKLFGDPKNSIKYHENLTNFRNTILSKMVKFVNMFLQKFIDNFTLLPNDYIKLINNLYRVLIFKSAIRSKIDVIKSCLDFIFDCFIYPAMLNPENYGIVGDFPVSLVAKYNLMEIGKVLKSLIYMEIDRLGELDSSSSSFKQTNSTMATSSLPTELLDKFDEYPAKSVLECIWKLTEISFSNNICQNTSVSSSSVQCFNQTDKQHNINNKSCDNIRMKKATVIISDADLQYLLRILRLYCIDETEKDINDLKVHLDKIELLDTSNPLSICVQNREKQTNPKNSRDFDLGNTKFYLNDADMIDSITKATINKEMVALILPLDLYVDSPGMKPEEKVLKEYEEKQSIINKPDTSKQSFKNDTGIEYEEGPINNESKETNSVGGILGRCTTITTTTNSLSSLGQSNRSSSNNESDDNHSSGDDDNDDDDDDDDDRASIDSSIPIIVKENSIQKDDELITKNEIRHSSEPSSSSSSQQQSSSLQQLPTKRKAHFEKKVHSRNHCKEAGISLDRIERRIEAEEGVPNNFVLDEDITQESAAIVPQSPSSIVVTASSNHISSSLHPTIDTLTRNFNSTTTSSNNNQQSRNTLTTISSPRHPITVPSVTTHNNSNILTTIATDDGASSSADLQYGWPSTLSGRDTPSISGGRESPSSSVGGLSSDMLPVISNKQQSSDVTDKFCKFDIPKTVEARSTVSDTWSTDVLASDSETTEQPDHTSRRLVEIQEENPNNQPLISDEASPEDPISNDRIISTETTLLEDNNFQENNYPNNRLTIKKNSQPNLSEDLLSATISSNPLSLETIHSTQKMKLTSRSHTTGTAPVNNIGTSSIQINLSSKIKQKNHGSMPFLHGASSNPNTAAISLDNFIESTNFNIPQKSNIIQSSGSESPSSGSLGRQLVGKIREKFSNNKSRKSTTSHQTISSTTNQYPKSLLTNKSSNKILHSNHRHNSIATATVGSSPVLIDECTSSSHNGANTAVNTPSTTQQLQQKIDRKMSADEILKHTSVENIRGAHFGRVDIDISLVGKRTVPEKIRNESVDQMLKRYDTLSREKLSTYKSGSRSQLVDYCDKLPLPPPIVPDQPCSDPPEQWPAWWIGKRNLRTVLQKRRMAPSRLWSHLSTTETHIDIKQTLMTILRVLHTDALYLQDDRTLTEVEETLRIIQIFDSNTISRMVESMLKDYRMRKVYIKYLVTTNKELQTITRHVQYLLLRCNRNSQLISRAMISSCVQEILRCHVNKFEEFFKKFKSLTFSSCHSNRSSTSTPVSPAPTLSHTQTQNSSFSSTTNLAPPSDESSQPTTRAQLVSDMLDWASKILSTQTYLVAMTPDRKQEIQVYLERMVMTQLHRSSITLMDDVAEVERDNLFHREVERLQTHITPYQLSVNRKYHSVVPFESAQQELRNINCYKTPMDKIECIKKTTNKIATLLNMTHPGAVPGADDILPVLIYVIIMANPSRLLSNVSYIKTLCDPELCGENQYMWFQFCGAVNEVMSLITNYQDDIDV